MSRSSLAAVLVAAAALAVAGAFGSVARAPLPLPLAPLAPFLLRPSLAPHPLLNRPQPALLSARPHPSDLRAQAEPVHVERHWAHVPAVLQQQHTHRHLLLHQRMRPVRPKSVPAHAPPSPHGPLLTLVPTRAPAPLSAGAPALPPSTPNLPCCKKEGDATRARPAFTAGTTRPILTPHPATSCGHAHTWPSSDRVPGRPVLAVHHHDLPAVHGGVVQQGQHALLRQLGHVRLAQCCPTRQGWPCALTLTNRARWCTRAGPTPHKKGSRTSCGRTATSTLTLAAHATVRGPKQAAPYRYQDAGWAHRGLSTRRRIPSEQAGA